MENTAFFDRLIALLNEARSSQGNDTPLMVKNDETLLASTWNVPKADISLYDPEWGPYAVALLTSGKSKSMEDEETTGGKITITYAKKVVGRMVDDYSFRIGLVFDDASRNRDFVYVYNPLAEGNARWVRKPFEDLYKYINDEVPEQLDIKEFCDKLMDEVKSLPENVKYREEMRQIFGDVIGEASDGGMKSRGDVKENPRYHLVRYGRHVSLNLYAEFGLIRRVVRAIDGKLAADGHRYCRFTGMDGLYRILDQSKESLCGLATMNDKSEGLYLNKCVNGKGSMSLYARPQQEIDDYNKVFIRSLCSEKKKDDLTMWRLYGGEDGDGVSLVYEVRYDYIKASPDFILMPVLYGDDNGIVRLFRSVKSLAAIKGFKFTLTYRNIWQYFVKPKEFKVEDEFRLLYLHRTANEGKVKPKWIYNGSKSIFHPIVALPMGDRKEEEDIVFPMELKEIVLGPRCREAEVNRVQLQSWLNSQGLAATVKRSDISFYR